MIVVRSSAGGTAAPCMLLVAYSIKHATCCSRRASSINGTSIASRTCRPTAATQLRASSPFDSSDRRTCMLKLNAVGNMTPNAVGNRSLRLDKETGWKPGVLGDVRIS